MKITNDHGLPEALYTAIVNSEKEYSGPRNIEDKISCTTLIGPPRIHFLRVRHNDELVEDAASRIWSLMGTLMHSLMEKSDDTNVLVEERQEKVVDGVTISGQADRITNDGSFEDYKFTTMYSVVGKAEAKPEWVLQLNVLNWIFHDIFKAQAMIIHAILRDWSKGKHKKDPVGVPAVQYKKVIITDIWPIEKADKYVRERVALFKSCKPLSDNDLPKCTSEDMWAKEDIWAIMKPGRVSAVKLCYSEQEAKDSCPSGHSIVVRPGERIRCSDYCNVSCVCNQYQEYLKAKGDK